MPNIETLVEDIYGVIEGKGGWDKTITDYLAKNISQIAESRFKEPQKPRGYLSLSSVGSPCKRKTWYRINKTEEAAPLKPQLLGLFFYGDLLEALVLSLAKAAGHDVQGEQDRLSVNGIKGHRDAVIDGVTIDNSEIEDTNLDNPEKFIDDLTVWQRALLVKKAKEKYNLK